MFKVFRIYTDLDNIKTCFIDKRNGKRVTNSLSEKKLVCLKETNNGEFSEIKLFVVKGSKNSDEYFFYLAEAILESLQVKLMHLKQLQNEPKAERRFVFLLGKLIKCESSDMYDSIISEYKSFSFFYV